MLALAWDEFSENAPKRSTTKPIIMISIHWLPSPGTLGGAGTGALTLIVMLVSIIVSVPFAPAKEPKGAIPSKAEIVALPSEITRKVSVPNG